MAYPGMVLPPVDPRELRPSRVWYVIAGVIAAMGLIAGPILLFLGVGSARSIEENLPMIVTEFERDGAATARLSAAKKWAIYGENPSGSTDKLQAECTGRAVGGGTINLSRVTYTFSSSINGRSWQLLYEVNVSQDGDYEVTCSPTDRDVAVNRFALGEDPEVGGFIAGVFGTLGAVFGAVLLPCGGLLIGGLIALVTGLRRSSHKKRLQQQRMGPPPPPTGYRPPY